MRTRIGVARIAAGVLLSAMCLSADAWADGGPVVIGGDDLTQHGSRSFGVNQKGWLYIEKALRHIDGCITKEGPFSPVVAALGAADVGCPFGAFQFSCPTFDAGSAVGSAATN